VAKAAALLELNARATLQVFDQCRMMPEQEHPEQFNTLVWESFRARSAAA
jgi:hypothetical protein